MIGILFARSIKAVKSNLNKCQPSDKLSNLHIDNCYLEIIILHIISALSFVRIKQQPMESLQKEIIMHKCQMCLEKCLKVFRCTTMNRNSPTKDFDAVFYNQVLKKPIFVLFRRKYIIIARDIVQYFNTHKQIHIFTALYLDTHVTVSTFSQFSILNKTEDQLKDVSLTSTRKYLIFLKVRTPLFVPLETRKVDLFTLIYIFYENDVSKVSVFVLSVRHRQF